MSSSSDGASSSDENGAPSMGDAKRRRRDEATYGSFLDDFAPRGRARDDADDAFVSRASGVDARFARGQRTGGGRTVFRRAGEGEGGGGGWVGDAGGAGRGLGFAGFASGGTMMDADAREVRSGSVSDEEASVSDGSGDGGGESEEEDLLPSTFGRRLVAGAAERAKMAAEEREKAAATRRAERKAARARNADKGDAFAGTNSRREGANQGKEAENVGSFEKHTKGIGMKLLEKMGYKKGEGLGKGASGISRALETQLRPKNMGMGFNNFKENVNDPTRTVKSEDEAESEEELDLDEAARARDEAKRAREQSMWKKRNDLRRQKREYKTAEEVLAEEDEKTRDPSAARSMADKLHIIDMRGAHAQVVNAAELHKARVARAGEVEVMLPELQHNLKLVVDLAESDITKLDGKIRSERDTLEILRREKVRLSKSAAAHEELAARTKSALELVQKCEEIDKACATLEEFNALTQSWTEVVKQFPKEYHGHRLHRLALSHAAGYVRTMFRDWDPAAEPTRGIDVLKPWRALLSPDIAPEEYRGLFDEDSFETLLREPMLSKLRPFISSQWDPTRASEVLDFVQGWSTIMPETLSREITHALVLPRLQRRVGEWEPTKERVALHVWFLPWLPLLHKNLKDLYPSIRQKFTVALTEWDANDGSALILLKPWQRVFEVKDWSSLMRRCITPKLEDALAVLRIDPSNQILDPLKSVLKWETMLGSSAFITLLEQHFFRKWHAALYKWLETGTADLDEVAQWYIGWKSVFSEELLSHERMRAQLNVALDMMNQAAAGEGVVKPNVAAPQPTAEERAPTRPAEEDTATLKEMIEEFANAHELEFVPSASGRRHDGLAVYSFGGISVVVDAARESIRASIDGEWIPVSLDQLLERANALRERR